MIVSNVESNPQLPAKVSDIFDPVRWRVVEGFDFEDMTYHRQVERDAEGNIVRDLPTVRIAFNRPEVRNAFRPGTVDELYRAMDHARMSSDVATVLLTGNGPSPKDGGHSFCSGGDQRIRGRDGYRYAEGETADSIDPARAGRLHILEVQRLMRTMPKVVIAVVNGWAAGGGHSLHVVSDLTIASREHGKFKQTDAPSDPSMPATGRRCWPARSARRPPVPSSSWPASTPPRTWWPWERSTRQLTTNASKRSPLNTRQISPSSPHRQSAC